jgi:hypothetical protein
MMSLLVLPHRPQQHLEVTSLVECQSKVGVELILVS